MVSVHHFGIYIFFEGFDFCVNGRDTEAWTSQMNMQFVGWGRGGGWGEGIAIKIQKNIFA